MKLIFTTSWDDGSVHDMRVAKLLSKYGFKGTFYIPETFDYRGGKFSEYGRRLTDEEIRSLASEHEVGAHTLSHKRLTRLSDEDAKREIEGGKSFLERVTGKPVTMFAFPGGEFDDRTVAMAREAGFIESRTTRKLAIRKPSASYLMDVTVLCQPYPFRKLDCNRYYWRRLLDPMRGYSPKQFALSWQSLARKWFKKACAHGGYFHLYGHSWEIEKYGLWDELESFLKFVKERGDIECLTNGEAAEQKATRPQMLPKEISFIERTLASYGPHVDVLEWGSGGSTVYFTRYLKSSNISYSWTSIEYNMVWFERVKGLIGGDERVSIELFDAGNGNPKQLPMDEYVEYPRKRGTKYDVIIVDGRKRRRCLIEASALLKPGGTVILHDARRSHYHSSFKHYADSEIVLWSGLWKGTMTRPGHIRTIAHAFGYMMFRLYTFSLRFKPRFI